MNLTHKILNTINYYEMLQRGDRVLVAVSGGPDSVFLLHILNCLKNRLGVKLYIAHLDHGIRGAASAGDAAFVKKLAGSLGLKLEFKKLHLTKSKSRLSQEEVLREKRYDFFKKTAKRFKIKTIATAHTLDDQAETVLMRIIKGASLRGLVGIYPVRRDRDLKFIRPLIEIEKRDIIDYLRMGKIPYKVDRTNFENRFLRNRVRQKILPYLSKVNPRVKRSLFNLAESLREDFEFIEEEKEKRKNIIKTKKSIQYINFSDIILQPKALQREIIREALKSVGCNIKKLTFRHWKDIDNLIRVKKRGKSIDIPGRVKIQKAATKLIFTR